jgi:hypothetical protein
MRKPTASAEADRLRRELTALHDAIRTARKAIETSTAALRTSQMAALIENVEHNIAALVSGAPATAIDAAKSPAQVTETERSHLAIVAPLDEPELPIPTPANDVRSIALVFGPEAARVAESPVAAQPSRRATIPDLDYFDNAVPKPAPATAAAVVVAPSEPVTPSKPAFEDATLEVAEVSQPVSQSVAPAAAVPEVRVMETATPTSVPAAAEVAATTFTAEIDFPPPAEVKAKAAETPAARPARSALSAIMSLTEVERLALFT